LPRASTRAPRAISVGCVEHSMADRRMQRHLHKKTLGILVQDCAGMCAGRMRFKTGQTKPVGLLNQCVGGQKCSNFRESAQIGPVNNRPAGCQPAPQPSSGAIRPKRRIAWRRSGRPAIIGRIAFVFSQLTGWLAVSSIEAAGYRRRSATTVISRSRASRTTL
jgi:hypothetical protein